MRALVAGGAGFIGSTLVDRLLAEGHAVDVVDDLSTGRLGNLADARSDRSAELRIHQVDVREREVADLVERRAPEVVFQLTTVARPEVAEDVVASVVGTIRLLEGARRCGARKVVVLLDASIYGDGQPPFGEADAGVPATPHGVAQLAAVEYLRLYREAHRLDFTVLVADAVYGPRQSGGVVVDAARGALEGTAPVVEPGGRDLLFVDDCVDALVRGMDRAGGLLLNVGWGRAVGGAAVASVVADAAGLGELRADPVEGPAVALDAGRARIHLGWTPWTPIEEGVPRVLQWLRASMS